MSVETSSWVFLQICNRCIRTCWRNEAVCSTLTSGRVRLCMPDIVIVSAGWASNTAFHALISPSLSSSSEVPPPTRDPSKARYVKEAKCATSLISFVEKGLVLSRVVAKKKKRFSYSSPPSLLLFKGGGVDPIIASFHSSKESYHASDPPPGSPMSIHVKSCR